MLVTQHCLPGFGPRFVARTSDHSVWTHSVDICYCCSREPEGYASVSDPHGVNVFVDDLWQVFCCVTRIKVARRAAIRKQQADLQHTQQPSPMHPHQHCRHTHATHTIPSSK